MTANELRIGNYIASSVFPQHKETWCIGKVRSIGTLDCKFEQLQIETDEAFEWFFKDNYFGIPLTEEWLLKFGFTKKGKTIFINDKFKIELKEDCFYFYTYHYSVKIKHVHQLQNLYFALTGEELEVKP